jgi:hypothetical protein
VGIVFDLRRILTSGVASFAAEYHSHFQILVGVCNQRQFSLSVLEGISLLGQSSELLELYKSFENFENFIQGSDFVVFRECFKLFPMPNLSHFSELIDHSGLADLFLHHAFQSSPFSELNVHEVVGKVMFSWNDETAARKYYDSLKPTVKIVLSVWGKVLEKCSLWNSSPPSLESLNSSPEFEAFLSSLFGSPAEFKAQFDSEWDIPTENLENLIQGCGISCGQTGTQESILSFLLSRPLNGVLSDWTSSLTKPVLFKNLPFTRSIQQVRSLAEIILS